MHNLNFEILKEKDINDMYKLQSQIKNHMQNNNIYEEVSLYELKSFIRDKGFTIGVRDEDRLVGYFSAYFPGLSDDNLGRDLCIKDLELVVHFEVSLILPEYRGRQLQYNLILEGIKYLKSEHSYRYICSTVYPQNYPSIKNLFKSHFYIYDLKEKYNGKMRYIYCRDLKRNFILEEDNAEIVDSLDYEKQIFLIKRGYLGYKVEKENERLKIYYAKREDLHVSTNR